MKDLTLTLDTENAYKVMADSDKLSTKRAGLVEKVRVMSKKTTSIRGRLNLFNWPEAIIVKKINLGKPKI